MSAEHLPDETCLTIKWEPLGDKGVVNLGVFWGDDLIYNDKTDVARNTTRQKLAKKLCDEHDGLDRAEVDARLLAIVSEVEQWKKNRPRIHREAIESKYEVRYNCFFLVTEGPNGPVETKLSNFVSEIAEEIIRDDGDEQFRFFKLVGSLHDGRSLAAEVPASKFLEMTWAVELFGAEAIIEAGRSTRDHVRSATQYRSTEIIKRTTYAHTGWREIDGEWIYLHASGAIRAAGLDTGVSVDLGEALKNYVLPAPPAGDDRRASVRASLGLLRFAQPGRKFSYAVAASAICYAYRAVIGYTDHSAQYNGLTGSNKTCMAALSLQHFGAGMGYKRGMPASWDSTANRLEWMQHAVKDALLVIDDFVPGGSSHDVARAHKEAARVFRTQGNGVGRGRLGSDSRPRPEKRPRGSVISTGEDTVNVKSANARTLAVRFIREDPDNGVLGTVDKAVLTACQADADAGLYAASMSAFVQWMAPQHETIKANHAREALELRVLATRPGVHARTPDVVADLAAAFSVFLRFAVEVEAIDADEAEQHKRTVWDGLMEAAEPAPSDDGSCAAEVYLRLLSSALATQQSHVADSKTGEPPEGLEAACGYRQEERPPGGSLREYWVIAPNSLKIGWTDGVLVYLLPDAAYQAAQRLAHAQGESFAVQKNTVHQQLDEAKKLVRKDSRNAKEGKNRLTSRESCEGLQKSVLVLRATELWQQDDPGEEIAV